MRAAKERDALKSLRKSRRSLGKRPFGIDHVNLDLNEAWTVLGGVNGVGKSRILRAIADNLGNRALHINLHSVCEAISAGIGSRDDLEEMKAEFEPLELPDLLEKDVCRVVGRDYDMIIWYSLEFELFRERTSTTRPYPWPMDPGQDPIFPYFEVEYRGISYNSSGMGLGELAVHALFWILNQHRDRQEITLLLDEPDAYLPPTVAQALIGRLHRICEDNGWNLIMSSHSTAIISRAVQEDAFVAISIDEHGSMVSTHCNSNHRTADHLLGSTSVARVFFVEDESALHLTEALLGAIGPAVEDSTVVLWGNGSGYMSKLRKYLPGVGKSIIKHAYIHDGDKRSEVSQTQETEWPTIFLPTNDDPDDLFIEAKMDLPSLAERAGVSLETLRHRSLLLEGADPHDWVNGIAVGTDRQRLLRALADQWVEKNPKLTRPFLQQLRTVL